MALLDEREAWLRLALTPGLTPLALAQARKGGDGPQALCRWPAVRWREVLGGRGAGPTRRPLDVPIGPVLARTEALGQRVLTPADGDWPRGAFEGLSDPPCALYLAGRLPEPATPCVAVVGTRRATPYGLRVARALAETLARRGVCVVSGLALGIDAAAHTGALAAGGPGPPTLAVLGNGLAVSYPPENGLLAAEIAARGGCLSEHPPDVAPERWHFPRRNRLVAALARAVVVVEAPERSGALQTAGLAVEAGREVFAVPGPIDRFTHAGCHGLLVRLAARLCRGADDVLESLGLAGGPRGLPPEAPPATLPPPGPQLALWSLLDRDEAQDADTLCLRSGLAASEVAAALGALELDGRAVRLPGVGYRRA